MATKVVLDKQLVKHLAVARAMDIDAETLRNLVAKGEFPEPHSVFGVTWLYDRAVIDHYLATGTFPEGAKFRPQRRTGA